MDAVTARKNLREAAEHIILLEENKHSRIQTAFAHFSKWYQKAYQLLEDKQCLPKGYYPSPEQLSDAWETLTSAAHVIKRVENFDAGRMAKLIGNLEGEGIFYYDQKEYIGRPAHEAGAIKLFQRAIGISRHIDYMVRNDMSPHHGDEQLYDLLYPVANGTEYNFIDYKFLSDDANIAFIHLSSACAQLIRVEKEQGLARG